MSRAYPTKDDYYQILGVLRSAKLADITAAYYGLARKCHPDISLTNPTALARFKLINQAYEVLSDENKRRVYDRQSQGSQEVSPPGGGSIFTLPTSLDCASEIAPAGVQARHNDIELELPIAPEEAFYGGPCDFTLKVAQVCQPCSGRGSLAGSRCEACRGAGTNYESRRLQITLPRRTRSGTVIRISRQSKHAASGNGDLLLRLRIQPSW